MHDSSFLSQIVILFGTALAVTWAFRVVRAPAIIGFLFTGILIGPSTFAWIERESVDQFAELGLVLLLFTIGLELAPGPLLRTGVGLLKAMLIQVAATAALTVAAAVFLLDSGVGAAVLLGIAVSLSSTAISLKLLSDRGEVQTAMGSLVTGILLLQDVFVIGVMVLLPLVTGGRGETGQGPLFALMAFLALVVTVIAARYTLPWIITQLRARGGQELTTLFAVLMAGGGAYLASAAGWSPALGACIAGLLLANADIRQQLVADITPFRDVFNALFFISIGMLVNTEQVLNDAPQLLVAIVATIALKGLITFGAVRIAGWPTRIAIQVGVGLCTVSEFAYVLLHQAEISGFISHAFLESSVSYIVGTMMLGAFVFPLGVEATGRASVLFREDQETAGGPEPASEEELTSHVVIVGYGVNGHNLVRVLKSTNIPCCVVEMNQALVREARDAGVPVVVGDATRLAILQHAGLMRARALVVGINDVQATRRIVSIARAHCPALHIVVRTPYVNEFETLTRLGADVVVPADFEASVRIFSHVLEELDVPRNILAAQIAAVRAGGYGVFRGRSTGSQESLEDLLRVLQIAATQTFFLSNDSPACGKTLRELDLRRRTGATIIAVVRDRKPYTNPPADMALEGNDVLVLVGSHAQLREAQSVLNVPEPHVATAAIPTAEEDAS